MLTSDVRATKQNRAARPALTSSAYFLGLLLLPLILMLVLRVQPQWDVQLSASYFHFEIVSFTSLTALVLALLIGSLAGPVANLRALFVTLALMAISGVFLIHGIATPGVLFDAPGAQPAVDHSGHTPPPSSDYEYGPPATTAPPAAGAPASAGPSNAVLAVTWSAPISLFLGAVFMGLATVRWPAAGQQWLLSRRRALWWLAIALYSLYIAVVVIYPSPLQQLSSLSPVSLYIVGALAVCVYAGSAVYFWNAFRKSGRLSECGLAAACALLAEAVISMATTPVWHASWWLYHALMAIAFVFALGAVVVEYERARHFDLKHYFAALGVIVTVLLAMLAGELATHLFSPLVNANDINQLRWGTSGLFLGMAALMLAVLYQVVRRGDQLLRENSSALQKQQAMLERARMAEALVPIGLAMGATLDLDRVLDTICEESLRLFAVDGAYLWLKEGSELIGRAGRGHKHEEFIGLRQTLAHADGMGTRMLREHKPLLFNFAQAGASGAGEVVARLDARAVLGVPFVSDGETLGALMLTHTRSGDYFDLVDLEVATIFGQQAALALTHARLYATIRGQAAALVEALGGLRASYQATLRSLSAALDARDRETEGHSQRVTRYALHLAQALSVSDPTMLESLEWGALMHDVGKIGVPDAILLKPGRLTGEEWQQMRRHPETGYAILRDVAFLRRALDVVLHHHERWDGAGYPGRLAGEAIPLGARIFAVADTLDAVTTSRPYRAGRSFADARAEIVRHRSLQFDPAVVDAFVRIPDAEWQKLATQAATDA